MTKQLSYVIIAREPGNGGSPPAGSRHRHVAGRHRLGAPGTTPRYPAGRRRQSGRRKVRHRRAERRSAFAVRYATLLVLLGMLGISGWFAATGATAVAQMIQP
jgi:hypothetical protein